MSDYAEFKKKVGEFLALYDQLDSLFAAGMEQKKKNKYLQRLDNIANDIKNNHIKLIDSQILELEVKKGEKSIDDLFDESKGDTSQVKFRQLRDKRERILATDLPGYRQYLQGMTEKKVIKRPARKSSKFFDPKLVPKWAQYGALALIVIYTLLGVYTGQPVSGLENILASLISQTLAVYIVLRATKAKGYGPEDALSFVVKTTFILTLLGLVTGFFVMMFVGATLLPSILSGDVSAIIAVGGVILLVLVAFIFVYCAVWMKIFRDSFGCTIVKSAVSFVVYIPVVIICFIVISLVLGIVFYPLHMVIPEKSMDYVAMGKNQGIPFDLPLENFDMSGDMSVSSVSTNRYAYTLSADGKSVTFMNMGATVADCKAIPSQIYNICIKSVAENDGDPSICMNVEEGYERDTCYGGVAKTTGNAAVCDMVKEDFWKESCLSKAQGS